ncbi:MAG: methylenetetrahydrofolate reductase [NAD(P)H] [Myxococcales bacterium]|nr:methylenetetrahydrofolate reductase [NAD(P)H] [Myxococcota bacterium]MDW8280422.1 methylenetetrahydrofolate reductase [NAD(P)H] [Myxococcales bacterium]
MRIAERLLAPRPSFSFEFFPPRTQAGVESLFETLYELRELSPDFVSVTYGAGGSTQQLTTEIVSRIRGEVGIEAMAHLTCVGHSATELAAILDHLQASGVENVLALRGDPPRDPHTGQLRAFSPVPGGFRFASELARFIRNGRQAGRWSFCIGGACYPEGHIECPSREQDLAHLVQKVEAGAEFLITQLFFDNAFYFDFVQRAQAARIRVPILPGIMPITSFEQVERFTRLCGATIPMRLRLQLERYQGDPDAILQLGVAHATVQCMELLSRGAPGIHFYTLNRSRATRMIMLALRGWLPQAAM